MDRRDLPWRVLEQPDAAATIDPPSDGSPTGEGMGRPADLARHGAALAPTSLAIVAGVVVSVALVLVAIVLVVGGPSPRITIPTEASSDDPGLVTDPAGATTGPEVVIEVVGAVARPGLYRLAAGTRVADAIAAAGGYGPRVDIGRATIQLNLAARLADGDRVVVPSRDDPKAGSGPVVAGGTTGGGSVRGGGAAPTTGAGRPAPVDLNHASASELDTLPGIGPVTAAKIVAARDERPFATVDELRSRKIVGQATFEKLRDLVVVR